MHSIDYRVRVAGLPLRWRTLITAYEPPSRFVDEQLKGPYSFWHHTHEFVEVPEGTLVRDTVRYALPLGALGDLAAGAFVAADLEDIFRYRRKVIGAVFPVFVSTYSAVRNIERTQINAALCLGATPAMLIKDILIPGALPVIFPGLRIALGVGWMCVVAAELIAAQSGLGYMIQQSRLLLQTQYVVTGMIVIGLIGFAMNGIMSALERKLVPWQPSARSS